MKLKEKLLAVGVSATLAASVVYDAVVTLEDSAGSFPGSTQVLSSFGGDSDVLAYEGESSAIQLISRQLKR